MERMKSMLKMYGECCKTAQAAKILGVSPRTVARMASDGRIRYACAGRKIDVRSLCEYIEEPAECRERARVYRARRKNGKEFAV